MDSMDNFRERFEALEQRTEQWKQQTQARETHTHTVERRLRWWRGLACGVGLVGLVSLPLPSGMATEEPNAKEHRGWRQRVQQLEAQVTILQEKLAAVTFDATAKELVLTGANLRIVNGLGSTDCTEDNGDPIPNCPNRLGNLIVGYNEKRDPSAIPPNMRTGSHNVVVGRALNFSRFGGIVVGEFNDISGDFASVSGGSLNRASGPDSWVSGGTTNTASGDFASVSGGRGNTASGVEASVSGGIANTASGNFSSVSGGSDRQAPGDTNWAAGSLLEPN